MGNAARGTPSLYARYIAASVRGQLQYRTSVLMLSSGQLMTTALEFFSVWALFERFGTIGGWTFGEIALLYGLGQTAFGIAEMAGRGFKDFSELVRTGDFDRLLLRPLGTAFQVGARKFEVSRMGRFVQGLAALAYGITTVDVHWSVAKAGLLVLAVGGGACTFIGVFIVQATLAFWTVQSLEIVNALSYGGVETTQYPFSIYPRGFRGFFTYVVPLAFVAYVPSLVVLDRPSGDFPGAVAWASPLFGLAFLLLAMQLWKIGVRHYRSTGS